MPKSDSFGRSLEFAIVKQLVDSLPKGVVSLTTRAKSSQIHDHGKFATLSKSEKNDYEHYANLVMEWLSQKFSLAKENNISIDRISDVEGQEGDVTDIRISVGKERINLSIKHNHSATKHQRPPTMATQFGFQKKGTEDIRFRRELNSILEEFKGKALKLIPDVTEFNELKSKNPEFIDKNLYLPVCLLVADFINRYGNNELNAMHYFQFLIGKTDFYKIKATKGTIIIQNFASLPIPKSIKASVRGYSYVALKFSNGWELSMRLHTASSKFGTSLKFDTQLENNPVPIMAL